MSKEAAPAGRNEFGLLYGHTVFIGLESALYGLGIPGPGGGNDERAGDRVAACGRLLLGRPAWLDGSYQYELWFSRGDAGTIYGMRASLEGAQHLYMQKLG
ncbi:Uncharacterised protein [Bordetella pertussis]|nr:Uncharacterised protein [Bordetella pertussis]